ncbi:G protein pathway suppressor 2 isoform X2 [Microplitis demolitor]|uniref:G protein pathway suppressor 2 isoform X2 n=1 Tax=Microplitis demolitor TaxID=69319 RepID=UPI0004CD0903|nr:G protein pathway suppressor 2 isoform X2 [Microplitis demolitor]
MPAIVSGPPQQSEHMWQALKNHITRERQRKKQEQEADAEEERLRKERERQQKQDVMTLGETREQICNLEAELSQLKDEKHQLFLQLKKVLNEDDNRRRQLTKETNICSDVLTAVGNYQTTGANVVHQQLFLPLPTRSPLYKVATAATSSHTLMANGPLKRSHSPSPPPSASSYHTVYGYKPPPMPNYNSTHTRDLRGDSCGFPESDDAARRTGDSRAVLWNKNNQYPPSTFYSTHASQGVYSYSAPTSQSSRESDQAKSVYLPSNRATITHQPAYVTNLHSMDHNNTYPEDKFYLRPSNHVTVHGGAIPIQQQPQGAKTGSITSGYPVRAPKPPPGPYPPPGTYVSSSATNSSGRFFIPTGKGFHTTPI